MSNLDSRQFRHRFDGYHFVIHPHIGIPIEYRVNSLIFKSGIALSQRGAKFQPGTFIFRDKFFKVTYTYLELPLLVSYFIKKPGIGIQSGIVLQKRIETNSVEYGERNYIYGADLRSGIYWMPFEKVQLELNYTMGNFDKVVYNIEDNYIHHVFHFGLRYRLFKISNLTLIQ
ncbi:MAG: hypothetical protein IPM92_05985 [Saprospiraceae bacterium]|nr:hypothetical protein [Saprospiraceae bacterium]